MICPSCGIGVPPDAKFCSACGQALHAKADERRVATVLFADLVGFTTLSEHMDPEQLKNLVDQCFERLVADLASFGGRVDKIVGDAVIALFGAPVAHEDDAERAVRAALTMRDTLGSLAGEIGIDVQMRIGINTGEVLVGGLRAGGDYTAMGDVVNTASRLQTAAAPGQILVGEATHSATASVIRYESRGELQARGREEPVRMWAAEEATAPPGYRQRSRSPLVGRDPELGLLERTLSIAAARRRPQLVLLLGDAGMGKSRLASECAAVAEARYDALVLEGRCVPYGEANQWWPVAEAIRGACGVTDSDPVDVALRKCKAALAEAIGAGPDAPDVATAAHGLLYIMGHQRPDLSLQNVEPARARDESLRAVRMLLEGLARTRMVVFVLGELHWADGALLEALNKFLDRIHNVPLVVVGTARPELEGRWAPAGGRYNLVTIKLDPLDADSLSGMLTALLGSHAPRPLRDFLLERAGGNPLFLEELVALLTEAGVIAKEDGQIRFDITRDVPPTLRGLVSARLDSLAPPERSLLEDAAVVGRTGQIEAVLVLARSRVETRPAETVEALVAKDLLVAEDGEYEFKSDLVREIAYETLTKAERARRHATVAAWLAARSRDTGREDEFLEQVAHHYADAADLAREIGVVQGVPSDIEEKALASLERAAQRALRRDSHRLALHHLDHAHRLAKGGDHRGRILLARARARTQLRELSAARDDLRVVLDTARETGDLASEAGALAVLGEVEHREGASEAGAQTLRRAIDMWREIGDDQGTAEALQSLGETEMFRGELGAAEQATAGALDLFRKLGDQRGEAWGLRNLAWIAFSWGDLVTAEDRLRASAAMFTEIEDRGGTAWALGFLAWVRFMQGRLDEAEELARPVLSESEDDPWGDPFGAGMMLVLQGQLHIWRGRLEFGVESFRQAATIFHRIGDAWGQVQAALPLASTLVSLGRFEESLRPLADARKAAPLVADPRFRALVSIGAAGIATHIGDGAGAERELHAAFSTAGSDGFRFGDPGAIMGLALLQQGRVAEGRALLESVAESGASEGLRANLAGLLTLALAGEGRPDEALKAAAVLRDIPGGTYRDRVVADAGRGLALAQLGRFDDAETAFESAATISDATDSALDQALVRLARGRGLETLGSPQSEDLLASARARLDAMQIDAGGWDSLFALAASGQGERAPSLSSGPPSGRAAPLH